MKRILIAGIGGVAMVAMLGTTGRYVVSLHDSVPECCQKKESCCPGSSCCKGGGHSHLAECPMMKHA